MLDEETKKKLLKVKGTLDKGLKEMANDIDDLCDYPNCDECGECYFREALRRVDNIIQGKIMIRMR